MISYALSSTRYIMTYIDTFVSSSDDLFLKQIAKQALKCSLLLKNNHRYIRGRNPRLVIRG